MSATSLSTIGGYVTRKIHTYDPKYVCLSCSQLLKRPVQLECGHRICFSCFEDTKKKTAGFYCKLCKQSIALSEVMLDKGFQKDMSSLDVVCHLCEWQGKLTSYEEHLEQKHQQLKCEYCDEIVSDHSALKEHEDKSCQKKLLNCPLHEFGCKTKFLRSQRHNHFASEEHQKIVVACITYIISNHDQLNRAIQTNENTNMDIDASDRQSCTSSVQTRVPSAVMDNSVSETIEIVSNGVSAFDKDLRDLDLNSTKQLESITDTAEQLEKIKISTEESTNNFNGMHTNISIIQQELLTLKEKYDEQSVTSYNGTYIWKITRVQEKLTDAKSERQVSIYSPPFRSSTTGYKMCARLYLYGDGNARRTHVSLFFVLMRGPHDSLLKFPFNYKVTFCLYDQTSAQRHIIDSFRPDTRSSSFQRPSSDMNIASGIPKFVPLSIIETSNTAYVKDDTMFIKIMVDFENVSKTMLSYVINLNPGLPMSVQQRMILEETKKREKKS